MLTKKGGPNCFDSMLPACRAPEDPSQRDRAKAEKMLALCREFGRLPISMKNDGMTIYGEGVTRRPAA